ncbi:hypothetical protein EMIHUDRAFT_52552, partial [Emiliania huxleyi CCMP1516]|uniref:Major facilitator superfamily (MFS) profile domain-containing protein n=2 Tax=Emiliania huxleyi TaxID=2903 RepID=A0A0D3JVU2_EMIH1
TFVLLCAVIAIDKADQILLPAVYLEVCNEFGAGPAALGMATFWRGIVQSIVALAVGPLGGRYDRVKLIAMGCVFWSVASLFVGSAASMHTLVISRALNGVGIGLVIPLVYALVADLCPANLSGRAFGVLNFANNGGAALGGFLATQLADTDGAVAGWRLVFYSVAVVSCATAAVLLCFGRDVRPALTCATSPSARPPYPAADTAKQTAWHVATVPTFLIVILQGAVGSAPWYSMSFLTLYFELRGLSHAAAGATRSLLDTGAMFGNLLGGALNDLAARLAPTHGRVLVGQLSVFSGLPIFLLLFYGSAPRAAAPLMLLAGLLVSWCGGVNNSMMAEVVDPALRTTIYGLDRALEGVVAPVGGLAAGWIAEEFFGFAQSDGGALHDGGAEDAGNAKALGDALAVTMLVPWGFCFLAYSLLHCTYGRDKRKTEAA